eukprot:GGOE01014522.1.p1 GENE.GGOE01014522.1~~GGOE01014522.1.p1  ORF type:complete len:332 (+),score=142.47 GGOE01014522.1:57-1052(+)
MSEFKRLQEVFGRLKAFLDALDGASIPDLGTRKSGIVEAMAAIEEWRPKVDKMRAKALEKDKDKQVYGEAMVKRVLDFLAEWDPLLPRAEEWDERIETEYAPHRSAQEAEAEAERRRKEQQEREARQQEEERRRRAAEEAGRQAAEIAEQQRQRLETERLQREAAERAAHEERERELQRRADLATYLECTPAPQVLLDSVRMLERSSEGDRRRFEAVLQAVYGIMSNVISYPDEEQFKTIRKSNARFHEDVGSHPGAIGCLFAIGFRERYEENETVLELVEPCVEEDYEEWKEWFDEAMAMKAKVERVFEALKEERYHHRPLDLLYILGSG